MGRLLIVLGALLFIGGIAATAYSAFSVSMAGIGDMVNTAVNSDEEAAKYCKAGETLVKEQGAETYSPTEGYGRSTQYYCENAAGTRRDVTGEFVTNLVGQAFNGVGGMFNFSVKTEYMAAALLGLILVIAGSVLNRNKRKAAMVDALGGTNFNVSSGTPVIRVGGQGVTNSPDLAQIIQQAQAMKQQQSGMSAGNAGDLVARLRQLEEARNKNLITQEEYDRVRRQILGSMQ